MKEWLRTLALGLIIALAVNVFVLQVFRVDGHSMLPNLRNGEFTLIYKMNPSYRHGDIVVIDSRLRQRRTLLDSLRENALAALLTGNHESYLWIKRVIGLPGDTLVFDQNRLYRNGRLLREPYINEPMQGVQNRTIRVPPGDVFVMGDNRNHSTDSRVIGPVPLNHVVGKLIFKR